MGTLYLYLLGMKDNVSVSPLVAPPPNLSWARLCTKKLNWVEKELLIDSWISCANLGQDEHHLEKKEYHIESLSNGVNLQL